MTKRFTKRTLLFYISCFFRPLYRLRKRGQVQRSVDRVSKSSGGVHANALRKCTGTGLTPALLRSPTLSSLRGKRVSCIY
jgi:hypothetical protein